MIPTPTKGKIIVGILPRGRMSTIILHVWYHSSIMVPHKDILYWIFLQYKDVMICV